jgi:hypothetical protein
VNLNVRGKQVGQGSVKAYFPCLRCERNLLTLCTNRILGIGRGQTSTYTPYLHPLSEASSKCIFNPGTLNLDLDTWFSLKWWYFLSYLDSQWVFLWLADRSEVWPM